MASLFYMPFRPAYDSAGISVPGAQAWFTLEGTNTPSPVYSDSGLTTPLSNPLVANAVGKFPTAYMDSAISYRVRIYARAAEVGVDTPLEEMDPYSTSLFDAPFYAGTRAELAQLSTTAGPAILTEAGRQGVFVWSSDDLSTQVAADAAQGIYVAPATDTDGSSGAWVRKYDGPINAAWFGTGSAAMAAAQTYIASVARSGYGFNNGVPMVDVPFSVVNFTAAFDVTWPIHWRGMGDGGGSNAATVLAWNNTSSGLRIQYVDTTGDSGTQAPASHSGSGAIFEGFHFDGGYTNGDEAERHGALCRAKVLFRNCNFFNWAGDAILIDATTVGAHKGNANLTKTENCWAQNVRNGIACAGNDDTNAGHHIGFSANSCRRWGILENSFLGNQIIGGHFDNNARTSWNTGGANRPCSYVSIGGYQYFVIEGQATGASTNAPKNSTVTMTIASPGVVTWNSHGLSNGTPITFSTTGALPTGLAVNTEYYVVNAAANTFEVSATVGGSSINTSGSQSGTHTAGAGVDNTYWGAWKAGGVDASTGVPLWTNGINVRSGGPIMVTGVNNATTIAPSPHVETNGVCQLDQLASWFGGSLATNYVVAVTSGALNRNRVPRIFANSSGLNNGGNLTIYGQFIAGNSFNILGPIGTTAQDGVTVLGTRSTQHTLQFSVLDQYGTVTSSWLSVASGSGFGRSHDFNAGLFDRWKINGVEVFKIDSNSFGYSAGGAVTQATSKSTGVTINKASGQITLNNAALGATTTVTFTVTNSAVAATDTVRVDIQSGNATAGTYQVWVEAISAGSFKINVRNMSAGSLSEALVLNYAVIKGANA